MNLFDFMRDSREVARKTSFGGFSDQPRTHVLFCDVSARNQIDIECDARAG